MKKEQAYSCFMFYLIFASAFFTSMQAIAEGESDNNEQYYISPNLQLGLHTEAKLDSLIKALLNSGQPVELIKSEEDFSLIKTPEDEEGWVKTQFITTDEPASLLIEKMKQQAEKSPIESACAVTDKEKAEYEDIISDLKEEIKAWEQLDYQDKQALKEGVEKNNRILREKLAMIASIAIGQEVDASQFSLSVEGELPQLQMSTKQTMLNVLKKNYLLLTMIAALSFVLGLFLMDLANRRRHGGYRI